MTLSTLPAESAVPAAGRRQAQVLARLRTMIMQGEIKAGEHLQEVPLSTSLGVSRTPIREALVVLAHEGLLVYRANRGYVVREFLLKDVLNAYLVRECLEGLACRQLAEEGLDDNTAEGIRACLADGDRIFSIGYLREDGIEPWRRVNDQFHTSLLHATGNHSLIEAHERTVTIPFSSSRVVHWFDPSDTDGFQLLRQVHQQHHGIFEAILRRQVYRAEAKMREHINFAAEHIQRHYPAGRNQPGTDF